MLVGLFGSLLHGVGVLLFYLERNSGTLDKLWSSPACRNVPEDPSLYCSETQLAACSSWPCEEIGVWWYHQECCQPCLINEEKMFPFCVSYFSLEGICVCASELCSSSL